MLVRPDAPGDQLARHGHGGTPEGAGLGSGSPAARSSGRCCRRLLGTRRQSCRRAWGPDPEYPWPRRSAPSAPRPSFRTRPPRRERRRHMDDWRPDRLEVVVVPAIRVSPEVCSGSVNDPPILSTISGTATAAAMTNTASEASSATPVVLRRGEPGAARSRGGQGSPALRHPMARPALRHRAHRPPPERSRSSGLALTGRLPRGPVTHLLLAPLTSNGFRVPRLESQPES